MDGGRMPEAEVKTEQPSEQTLADFTGDKRAQLTAKTQFISKWGLAAYEKIVSNSNDPSFKKK